jgi:formyltetrahydrofolate hydrolase
MTAGAQKHSILNISYSDARDIEDVALPRYVRYYIEHCILLNGTKTLVSRQPQPGCTK